MAARSFYYTYIRCRQAGHFFPHRNEGEDKRYHIHTRNQTDCFFWNDRKMHWFDWKGILITQLMRDWEKKDSKLHLTTVRFIICKINQRSIMHSCNCRVCNVHLWQVIKIEKNDNHIDSTAQTVNALLSEISNLR